MLKAILSFSLLSLAFSFHALNAGCEDEVIKGNDAMRAYAATQPGMAGMVLIPKALRSDLKGRDAILLQYVPSLAKGESVYALASGKDLILAFSKPQSKDTFFLYVEVTGYFQSLPTSGFKIVRAEHQPVDALVSFHPQAKLFQVVSVQSIIKALDPKFKWTKIRGFHEWSLIPRDAWLTQPLPNADRIILPETVGDWFAWVESPKRGPQEVVVISDIWHWVYATKRRREDRKLKYGLEGDRYQRLVVGEDALPDFLKH